ncbi:MAG: CcmD family protein [Bacteroidota bacterium]
MKKYYFFLLFWIIGITEALADSGAYNEMMYSSGKIYVVLGVILIMFVGIIAYLIYLDRKLTKLENQINYDD